MVVRVGALEECWKSAVKGREWELQVVSYRGKFTVNAKVTGTITGPSIHCEY